MNRTDPLLITIDGPAGSGKTTLAKQLAQELAIAYLDTGAMFRGIALYLGENSWNLPLELLQEYLSSIKFQLTRTGSDSRLLMNEAPLSEDIRSEKVGIWASHLGQNTMVREYLKKLQQEIGNQTSLVTEGRDMGTVVFPHAKYKFYLDASAEERAKRRWEQLRENAQNPDYNEILYQLRQRDEQDMNRSTAPLKPAEDAIVIDTTHLDKKEVFSKMLQYVQLNKS
ncbi:MAG: (d)CMP kinase [Thermodesulfobacteriota bacterium]